MFESKAGLILLYLTVTALVCLWPFVLTLRPPRQGAFITAAVAIALAVGAGVLLFARGLPGPLAPIVLAPALVLPLLGAGMATILAGLSALVLLAGVVWWAPPMQMGFGQAGLFVLIGLGAAFLPWIASGRQGLPKGATFAALLAIGLAAVLATGVFAVPTPFMMLWHHWSAYVAPAEALLAGGVPFRDFPVQYGMGPTLLIVLACGGDCWPGTYALVAAANLGFLLAMGACVWWQTREAPRGVALLALLALVAAVIFWAGYPPDFLGGLATPSVGGLRFLPLALMLLHVLQAEARGVPRDARGHALWLLGLAWSPEAGFFVSLLWWPYLALRDAQARHGSALVLAALAWGALRGVMATALGLALLLGLFRLAFSEWPSLYGFLAYVRNPPGILPPNPLGPVWLLPATLAVALVAMARTDARGVRTGFAGLAALTAAASYYLGRSHDNNALNLFPFVVVALVPAAISSARGVLPGFARSVMAGLLAWITTFGHASWSEAWAGAGRSDLGPAALLRQMRLEEAEARALMDQALAAWGNFAQAGDVLAAFRALEGEATPVLVHPYRLMPRWPGGRGWTGVNNIGNFGDLPPQVIAHFVQQGRRAYDQPGWILQDRSYALPWLAQYLGAYRVAEERVFGGYTAYRMVPR